MAGQERSEVFYSLFSFDPRSGEITEKCGADKAPADDQCVAH